MSLQSETFLKIDVIFSVSFTHHESEQSPQLIVFANFNSCFLRFLLMKQSKYFDLRSSSQPGAVSSCPSNCTLFNFLVTFASFKRHFDSYLEQSSSSQKPPQPFEIFFKIFIEITGRFLQIILRAFLNDRKQFQFFILICQSLNKLSPYS